MSTTIDFLTPLSQIRGFGTNKCALLRQMNIGTAGDFLSFFPLSYLDINQPIMISELSGLPFPKCVRGKIETVQFPRDTNTVELGISDISGACSVNLFVNPSEYRNLRKDTEIVIYFYSEYHADYILCSTDFLRSLGIVPVYRMTKSMLNVGLTQNFMRLTIGKLLEMNGSFPERLPRQIEELYHFESLRQSLRNIHFPCSLDILGRNRYRIHYEHFYQQAIALRWSKKRFACPGIRSDIESDWRSNIPFSLTDNQARSIDFYRSAKGKGSRAHVLFSGDPYTGKTVAAITALFALPISGQVVWICHSERAVEHFIQSYEWLCIHFAISPRRLSEIDSLSNQRSIVRSLKMEEIQFVVTTESMLTRIRGFKNLSAVVLDRPEFCTPLQRTYLHQCGASFDVIAIQDIELEPLELSLLSDFDQISFTEPVLHGEHSHRGVVDSSKIEGLCRFVRSRLSEGARVLVVISEQFSGSEVVVVREGIALRTWLAEFVSSVDVEKSQVLDLTASPEERISTEKLHDFQFVISDIAGLNLLHCSYDMVIVIEDAPLRSGEINALQREYVTSSANSWLFRVHRHEFQINRELQDSVELFLRASADLESILTLE